MANEGLFIGNMLQGYMLSRQMRQEREDRDKEIKVRTQLAEIQLRKMMQEDDAARQTRFDASTKQRLDNVNRDLITGTAELGVASGDFKSLPEALADYSSQLEMRRRGFDPEKDFGIKADPAEIQILKDPKLYAAKAGLNAAGATRIDTGDKVGKIPPGFVLTQGVDGSYQMMPIPGGPAAAERDTGLAKVNSAYEGSVANLDMLINKASALKDNPNLWMGVGVGGATVGTVPGTPGANVSSDIVSLASQVALDTIQAMRDASATGGAVGSVTEREWPRLEGKIASLSTAQTPAQFRDRLNDIIEWARDTQLRLKGAHADEVRAKGQLGPTPPALGGQGLGTSPPALGGAPVVIQSDEEYNKLPPGTVFIGPDAVKRRKP